jgi:SAM-dependent methyltransferase
MLKRYELFGWDYEIYNPINEKAVAWYLKHANDPVLELACGTGRLMIALAQAGHHVEGMDLSEEMRKIANENILKLPQDVQSRIHLHNMDMTNFQFENQFATVILADNSICELKTAEEQMSCLRCVWSSLLPSGRFLVTIRYHKPSEFGCEPKETPWSDTVLDHKTGFQIRRKVQTQISKDNKMRRGLILYKITDLDNNERIETCPFETPNLSPNDYLNLFTEAGFSVKIFADYEEKESDNDSRMLCYICEKIG